MTQIFSKASDSFFNELERDVNIIRKLLYTHSVDALSV